MSLFRRLLLIVVGCVVLASCRVDATVAVDVEEDGSGVVRIDVVFDADAASRVPDLATTLRTDDLTAAGWTVAEPDTRGDGSVVVAAEKAFAAPDELPAVLAEVSGAFQQMRLERSRSFGAVHWELTGRLDLTGGAEQFGDEQLTALLGQPLGRDIASLEQEIGSPLAESTALSFVAELPGDARGEWTVGLDQAAPTPVQVEGTVERTGVRLLAAVAVVAAGLFVLLVVLATLRGRHRRRSRGARRVRRDDWLEGPAPDPVAAAAPAVADRGPRHLQLVVTAAHGVLWESRVTAEEWLVNLVAMQGGTATRDDVIGVLREAVVGRIGSRDLWRALGVPGDPVHLDAAYVARFSLTAGVDDLVTALARRGIGIACLTNDVVEWSHLLRNRFGLDRTISPWIVSAEVGAVKPSAAAFDEIIRRTGTPFEHCMFIDDDLDHLDVARRLGMATVLVAPAPGDAPARGHGHVVDLGDLLRRRAGRAPSR